MIYLKISALFGIGMLLGITLTAVCAFFCRGRNECRPFHWPSAPRDNFPKNEGRA